MLIANTKQRCKNRQDILLDVLEVAGLPLSPKCKYEISQKGKLIGLYWSVDGHCLDDSAVDSLPKALLQKPSTKSEGKQIIGVINYSESAFHYTSKKLARHGELMATLNASIDNVNNRIQWELDCDQALQELRERMLNLKLSTIESAVLCI